MGAVGHAEVASRDELETAGDEGLSLWKEMEKLGIDKNNQYHWDGPDPSHRNQPHLQIHQDGGITRIFY